MGIPALFDEQRTTQAAAFFLHKAGGRMPLLKLMKLLYLAERESYRLYGEPISGDKLVSMPHGPVLSLTLDMMNGWGGDAQDGWNHWIEDRAGHELALRDPGMIRSERDLRALSDGDVEILHGTWEQFGHLGPFELVEYTHSGACPEWEDPNGSSIPIPTGRLLEAVGYDNSAVESVLGHLAGLESIRARSSRNHGAALPSNPDESDHWAQVERYISGEIQAVGGNARANAHVRLHDGDILVISADRHSLRDDPHNRLYKNALLRIRAEYNLRTGQWRNARLIDFVDQSSEVDKMALARMIQAGTIAWKDVPDASAWVDELRGCTA